MIRQIVRSSAYRQSSVAERVVARGDRSPTDVDPLNALLWRMRLRRLDAESMPTPSPRRAVGSISSSGGRPIPLDYDLKTGRVSEKDLVGTAAYRRSVYLENRRVYNPTFLSTFDKPIVAHGRLSAGAIGDGPTGAQPAERPVHGRQLGSALAGPGSVGREVPAQ